MELALLSDNFSKMQVKYRIADASDQPFIKELVYHALFVPPGASQYCFMNDMVSVMWSRKVLPIP